VEDGPLDQRSNQSSSQPNICQDTGLRIQNLAGQRMSKTTSNGPAASAQSGGDLGPSGSQAGLPRVKFWNEVWPQEQLPNYDLTPCQTTNAFDIERRPVTGIPVNTATIEDDNDHGPYLKQDRWVDHFEVFGEDTDDEIIIDWKAQRPRYPFNNWRPNQSQDGHSTKG
jgi:hypothetical protein